jgi:hypothetical protein
VGETRRPRAVGRDQSGITVTVLTETGIRGICTARTVSKMFGSSEFVNMERGRPPSAGAKELHGEVRRMQR